MSSSFVKDCTDSSGTSTARGNKTFIIFVNNDNNSAPLEGQEFQNLLVNHGADPSNVGVLQMGQPATELDFNLPQFQSGIENFDAAMAHPQVEQQPNSMVDQFGGDIGGYAELPIDEDTIQKLESVLHTPEAQDILGDALLDMVGNPMMEQLPPEESAETDDVSVNAKRSSPKRRSQRQMDKAEREEVEKILAENQLMLQKERDELRKVQEEKEETEKLAEESAKILSLLESQTQEMAISKGKPRTEPSSSSGKIEPPKTKAKPAIGKGKVLPGKAKGKLKKIPVTDSTAEKLPKDILTSATVEHPQSVNVANKEESLKLLKGVLREVSVNLEKIEVKNFSVATKNDDSEFGGFTTADASTAGDKLRKSLSPVKVDRICEAAEKDQKIIVVKRGNKSGSGDLTTSLSVQNVSPAVINKLKKISASKDKQKSSATEDSANIVRKNIADIKLNKKCSKELFLTTPDKTKSKNTSLCPPISKSLMNYKIPHKNANKTFYTSGYKKDSISKPQNSTSFNKDEPPSLKQQHRLMPVEKKLLSKDTVKLTPSKKAVPAVVNPRKVELERSVTLPSSTKTEVALPQVKHAIVAKPPLIKKQRPSFEVALNSSKQVATKPVKTPEKNNPIVKENVPKTTAIKTPLPFKTTVVHVKTKPTAKKEVKLTAMPIPASSGPKNDVKLIHNKLAVKLTQYDENKKEAKPLSNPNKKETKVVLAAGKDEPENNPIILASPVRKSKRPAKKKQMDDEFVCLNEDASSIDDEESDDSVLAMEDESESEEISDGSVNDYDDPNRLWCICQKPHSHRFMICCDSCEDWFHGSCVGITKAMGKVMEKKEEEWNCPRCKPITMEELQRRRRKRKKSKLRKWSEDPKTTNQDPSAARVLVYENTTGVVLSGTAAPTLHILQKWLADHPNFSPLLPSMMKSVITDPLTGLKSVRTNDTDAGTVTLSSDETSPVKVQRKKDEVRETKVGKSRDGGIIIKDSAYDYDPEFQPAKPKTPKKAILIDSIHPERLSKTLQPDRFYKKELKLEKRVVEKKKHDRKEESASKKSTHVDTPRRKSSQSDTPRRLSHVEGELTKKSPAALPDKSPKMNIRQNVKKMLFDALSFRKSQVVDEFKNISERKLTDICANIEEQLYETYNKDVGFRYKSRYRSLLFNIKDSKNGGLYRQILSGTISPSKLARMTSEELASKELAEWRQQAEKKELEAIQKHELELATMKTQYVMKTHKGEIEIVKDDYNKTKETAPELASILPEEHSLKEEELTQDQINHSNHIYDPTCPICKKLNIDTKEIYEKPKKLHKEKKGSHHSKRKKRDRDKRERKHSKRRDSDGERIRRRDSDRDRRRDSDRHHRRESEKRCNDELDDEQKQAKRQKQEAKTPREASERVVSSTSDDVVFVPPSESTVGHIKDAEPTSTVVGTPIEPEPYDDPLDLLLPNSPATPPPSLLVLKSPSPQTPPISDMDDCLLSPATPPLPEEADRHTPPPPPVTPVKTASQPIWRGGISMQDVATFNAAAFEVSGKAHYFTGDVPTGIDIVGRINPDNVWSYITQMKKSGSKEILVIRFQPSSEEEKVSYIALYCYLSSKKRYGVIGNCEKSVKDFYIIPLAAHQPLHQVLLPLDGPGFEESRPHMLIGVVIRSKHRRIYDALSGVWIDVGGPPPKKTEIASESPRMLAESPPPEFEDESYTPPQIEEDVEKIDSEGSPSPPPSKETKRKSSRNQNRDKFDMLAELNRQIKKDKEEISNMQKTFDKGMDDAPVSEEIQDSDPGKESSSINTSQIKLPSNLQAILDNIKRKEVDVKAKEMEIERRLNMSPENPPASDNAFTIPLATMDVDLRVPLRQEQFQLPEEDQDFRLKQSLSEMTDEQLISKASELETNAVPLCHPFPVEPILINQGPSHITSHPISSQFMHPSGPVIAEGSHFHDRSLSGQPPLGISGKFGPDVIPHRQFAVDSRQPGHFVPDSGDPRQFIPDGRNNRQIRPDDTHPTSDPEQFGRDGGPPRQFRRDDRHPGPLRSYSGPPGPRGQFRQDDGNPIQFMPQNLPYHPNRNQMPSYRMNSPDPFFNSHGSLNPPFDPCNRDNIHPPRNPQFPNQRGPYPRSSNNLPGPYDEPLNLGPRDSFSHRDRFGGPPDQRSIGGDRFGNEGTSHHRRLPRDYFKRRRDSPGDSQRRGRGWNPSKAQRRDNRS